MKEKGKNLFLRKKEVWKTTWKARILILFILVCLISVSKFFMAEKLAETLVCRSDLSLGSQSALIMNFDPNYLLFEETEKLIRSGQVDRVYVPVSYDRKRAGPNAVDDEFVRVMAQIARVREYELILVDEVEPIRYNVAVQIREYLKNKDVHSILVVSPGFSSRRDFLVYESVFHAVGMPIACLPVFGTKNVENWHESWHGIQEVFLELGKLWYYRLWVL